MKNYLLALTLICTGQAMASLENLSQQQISNELPIDKGGWSSGGGNAVVCFYPNFAQEAKELIEKDGTLPDQLFSESKFISSIQTYDLFEARLPRGTSPNSKPQIISIRDDESLEEYIFDNAMRFIDDVNNVTNTVLTGRDLLPQANIRFYDGAVVQNGDIGHPSIINKNLCVTTTIANQRNYNDFYELYIDARAFNHPRHERISKAALILHEYIYAAARQRGATDSLTTRKLLEIIITRHEDFTVNYVSRLVTEFNFIFSTLPSFETPNRHVFASSLVEAPTFMLKEIATKMAKSSLKYKNFELRDFIIQLKKLLEKHSVLLPLNINSTLDEVMLWYINAKIPLDHELTNHLELLKIFLSKRKTTLMDDTAIDMDRLLDFIDRNGASPEDKQLVKEALSTTYNWLIQSSTNYNKIDGSTQNGLGRFATTSEQKIYNIFQEAWISDFELNYNLLLNNWIK